MFRTIADIVITEDSDLALFGCDKIIFKLKDSVTSHICSQSQEGVRTERTESLD